MGATVSVVFVVPSCVVGIRAAVLSTTCVDNHFPDGICSSFDLSFVSLLQGIRSRRSAACCLRIGVVFGRSWTLWLLLLLMDWLAVCDGPAGLRHLWLLSQCQESTIS